MSDDISKPPKPRPIKEVKHDAPKTDKDGVHEPMENKGRPKPAFNSVVHSKNKPKTKRAKTPKKARPPKKGNTRSGVFTMGVIATLAGGTIGWLGPVLLQNTDQNADIQAQISALQTSSLANQGRSEALEKSSRVALAQQKRLQSQLQTLVDTPAPAPDMAVLQENIAPAIAELKTDFAALQPSIDALSKDINTRIDVLEGGLANGDTTSEGGNSQAILERFTQLEAAQTDTVQLGEQLTDLQKQVDQLNAALSAQAFPEPETAHIELPPVETPLDKEAALNILIDSFPRAKMLEAVHAQAALATQKPSWLQRTLSKHVKVRDENLPTPLATINAAETALKSGQINVALTEIGKLNPPVRAMAADWILAAKKTAKALDTTTP